jgi:SAM-dependent methyltransferase
MSALPPEAATRWYEDKVRVHGYDYRGLGFRTRTSQEKRFEALLGLGDLDGARLLDAGCGFGDFLAFLRNRGIEPVYTGVDICEPMIERCRERFPASEGRFVVSDALDYRADEHYDFVVASGLFGLDYEGAREHIRPTLQHLFESARVGLAANFLSTRSPVPAEKRIYLDPAKALEAAFALTPAVRLDHTYLPNDFTLYLYKTPAWEQRSEEAA